ncbi:AEC family transporter [Subtercola sp. PAMC28395]|uniref:AEC family transporter n=1 Tax=Subtercola sp. PAMC28395 TaxID=2846775 RepID=UPI001C0D7848|nr:AEC family transporter [Subtercola sp. PAMC28395]QWT24756.1 AEC family transporter [Subtercola sp. PAMC28395]
MDGVLTGFAIIGFVIVVGYVIQRIRILPADAPVVLNRFVFFIASPALLFSVLAKADLRVIFSSFLLVSIGAIAASSVAYVVLSRIFFRRGIADTTIGAAASSYANANNIGLPVSVYVLGSAQFVAPLLMFQVIVMAPILLALLDVSTRGHVSVKSILLQPVRNPIILGSLAGFIVAASGWQIPDALLQPFILVGGAAVPLVLVTFGMSLAGQRPFRAGAGRTEIVTASLLKSVLMPVVALLLARYVFQLDGVHLFAVVVLAALPTAQNIFNYAFCYDVGTVLARDTVLVTTIASLPVLLVISALLAPA